MNKTNILGMFALFAVALLVTMASVSAYKGDYSVKGPDFSEDRHELMESAFENEDYQAWYQIMSENGRGSRVLEKVTEENFAKFVQAHNAGISGDYELANQLRAELGLNNGNGPKDGNGFGRVNGEKNFKNQGMNLGNQMKNCQI